MNSNISWYYYVIFLLGIPLIAHGLYFLIKGKSPYSVGFGRKYINKEKYPVFYWCSVVFSLGTGIFFLVLFFFAFLFS